jgi:hypothetical protein
MLDIITNQLSSFKIIAPLDREHSVIINNNKIVGDNHVKITS